MPAPARHHRCAVVALVAAVVQAYPEYVNCGEELRIGQRWMGRDSEASTLAVSLTDAATNAPIACGSTVASGTRVRATIANLDSGEQYVVEAVGGVAYGNFCTENTRANDQPLEFDVLDTVSVIGAHAPSYGTVYVTDTCSVAGVGPAPTPKPSVTKRPTVPPTPYCSSERDFDFAYALDGGLTLHWTLENERVRAALVVDGGWAAIGWGSDGLMNGAECACAGVFDTPSRRWRGRGRRLDAPPRRRRYWRAQSITPEVCFERL